MNLILTRSGFAASIEIIAYRNHVTYHYRDRTTRHIVTPEFRSCFADFDQAETYRTDLHPGPLGARLCTGTQEAPGDVDANGPGGASG